MSQGNDMTTSAPTVSVLMTAYNRADFIADAMGSVLASDFGDFELIVVDDGSSDRTVEIARELEATDSRVRVYQNEKNLGDYPNRNHAASLARGTYLKYVDSDDMVYPWTLGVMVRCISRFPEAGLALAAVAAPDRPHPHMLAPAETYQCHFFNRDLFSRAPGSAIILREAFENVGGFSGIRQVGDLEFWLRICASYPLVTMPIGLTWDRVHAAQEKNLDSQIEKEAMSVKLLTQALTDAKCPMDKNEILRSLAMLSRKYRIRRLKSILIYRSISDYRAIRQKILPQINSAISNME